MRLDTELVGMAGAFFTTIAFVPQVIRAWRTKSVKDLSWGLTLLFFVGTILWLIYGISISKFPIIFSNAATMCMTGILVLLKIKYKANGNDCAKTT